MPKRTDSRSILLIGSGPIIIGQACEFDYSGTQAAKVLRREGFRVVLVNSNPATIMTDPEFADATYIEPITPEVVEEIIARERPDALLPTIGGQTALNLAMRLHRSGVLDRYGVELIGAGIDAIERAEDRGRFKQVMEEVGLEVPRAGYARSMVEAIRIAETIGFPVMVRPSFILGGGGTGIAHDPEAFIEVARKGFDTSPVGEILVEESVYGWKEFELEVMRDRNDNAVIVCSIENLDPMGIHTGDSITVAPIQTLSDREYQEMRDDGIKVLRAIGVETGGSNVQFAVDPATGSTTGDRDEPAGLTVVGPGLEGDRVSDREDRRAARGRVHVGRNSQRHHRSHSRIVRTRPRLCGRQGPPLRLCQVPQRPRPARDLDEKRR